MVRTEVLMAWNRASSLSSVVAAVLAVCFLSPDAGAKDIEPTNDEVLKMARAQAGERWYGIYVLGKKVGWQKDAWTQKEREKGREGEICVQSEFTLKMAFLSVVTTISTTEDVCYSVKPPFKLVSYRSVRDEDGRVVTITASASQDGKELVYNIDTGDNARESRSPEEWNRLEHSVPWAALGRMAPDDVTETIHYDELTNRKRWMKIRLVSREEKNLMGRTQEICKVLIEDESGMKLDSLITSTGIILEGSLGPSLRIVLEDKKTAINTDVQFLDLYSTSFIPATGQLNEDKVSKVRRLKLKLVGKDKVEIPETPRQKVLERGDNFAVVETTACPSDQLPSPLAGEGALASGITLVCTADVPCDLPEFKELVAKETKGAGSTLEKARLLSAWVHRSFKYRLGGGGGTGDVILKERSGDCTEFAKALVTLLRAAGIPSRVLSGAVVASANPLSFGYHAWVDAWVEGIGWTNLDPTWGHYPVDASHIVFDLDEGLQMASHLGGLSIEIQEVEYQEKGGIQCDSAPTSQPQAE